MSNLALLGTMPEILQIEQEILKQPQVECPVELMKKDYEDFLVEFGFTQEGVDIILNDRSNDILTIDPLCLAEIKESPIAGFGMFAIKNIGIGGNIGVVRLCGKRTLAGRYTNHSPTPNAIFILLNTGDLVMVAFNDITLGEEVTINYRQAGKVNGYTR